MTAFQQPDENKFKHHKQPKKKPKSIEITNKLSKINLEAIWKWDASG